MQHMGNSWQVAENGDFERENELTVTAQLIKRTLDDWLDTVGQKQRERAIDQIYEIFAAAGYGNIADLMANWTDSLPKIVAAARGTDRETRELIKAVVKAIPASAARAVREGCPARRPSEASRFANVRRKCEIVARGKGGWTRFGVVGLRIIPFADVG